MDIHQNGTALSKIFISRKTHGHLFIGELLKLPWLNGRCLIEIAKSEVDYQGYDFIFEDDGIIRNIQLKKDEKITWAKREKHLQGERSNLSWGGS